MGNSLNVKKIAFEDVQQFIQQSPRQQQTFMINVLTEQDQYCLIPHTVPAADEAALINRILENKQLRQQVRFIIYGRNSNDPKIAAQYMKLNGLGFSNNQLYVYSGGMFEWLLLQDIYGDGPEEFPTTSKEVDILKYKPSRGMSL